MTDYIDRQAAINAVKDALPKDGYCHLWEKRNVTDDDYPERLEE